MVNQDIIEKLRSLTNQQKSVLKGVCEGKPYKQIAKELFLSIETIKTHMGHVYLKLGLMDLPPTLRRKIIFEEYWPVFKEFDFDLSVIHQDEPEDTEEPEPVPEKIIEIVEKDELALMVVEPAVIDFQPFEEDETEKIKREQERIKKEEERIRKEEEKKKKGRLIRRLIMLLIILSFLVFGGLQVYSWAQGFLNNVVVPMVAQDTPEVIPTQGFVQPITQPTNIPTKEAVVVPTNTAIPPTPAPTKTPSPKISLPFYDNFSNGIGSPWNVVVGKWIVTETGATISISEDDNDTGSILLNDQTLTDYKLRVKVHTPHIFAPSQGQFGVVVRYSSTKDQNIILYMDSNSRFRWAYIESLSDLSFYQPPVTGVEKRDLGDTDVTVEIEVSGNTFTARVDGAKVDQFSMAGFENGGFALVTKCGSIGSCPSFSDLSIEQIN